MSVQKEESEAVGESVAAVAKTAKSGPMRAVATDRFAPPSSPSKRTDNTAAAEAKQQISLPLGLLRQLKESRTSDFEMQTVLTYALQTYLHNVRMEYMAFVEDIGIDHTWQGLLRGGIIAIMVEMYPIAVSTMKR